MKNAHRLLAAPAWIAILLAWIPTGRAGPVLLDFTPRAAAPGTMITVTGTGFGNDAGAVSARIGAVSAGVGSVAPQQMQLNAPAATGFVSVTVNGATATSLLPFTATRTVTGTFVAPGGLNAAGYVTGHVSNITHGPNFTVQAALQAADVVWAWGGANDPMFGALVMPGQATVQIDALSTAQLLIAMSPLAPKGDPVRVNEYLTRVAGTAELAAVSSLITAAAAGGYNYVRDGRFAPACEALLLKALTPPPGGRSPRNFVPPGRGYVHTLEPADAFVPQRVETRITQLFAGPMQLLEASPSSSNPTHLHQNLELWRVDARAFTDGFNDINTLSITDDIPLLDAEPYAFGFVEADLGSGNLDGGEWIGKGVKWILEGITERPSTDAQFFLPRHRAGVYVLNAYSGNMYFGARRVDAEHSQALLLREIDVNNQWTAAMAANVMVTAVDVAALFLPEIKFVVRKQFGEIVKSISVEVTKTVTGYIAAYGSLDEDAGQQILMTAAIAIVKAVSGSLATAATEAEWDRWFTGTLNILGTIFDVSGKVSGALQAVERGMSVITPTHYAVERTMVVIGDPFAPRITSFVPRSGRGGDFITLSGETLPFDASGYTVNFLTFEPTGSPPDVEKRLPATIVSTNLGSWVIRVPNAAQWNTVFGPGSHQVFIGIRNTASEGETSTAENPAPNQQFNYRALPQLTAAVPATVPAGSVLIVEGAGFDFLVDRSATVEIDGNPAGSPLAVTPARLYVQLSNLLINGPHTVSLSYRDSTFQPAGTTNVLNFTVATPYPPFNNNVPRRLRVNTRAFNNVRDGNLSLYEALALAAGALTEINVRPQGQTMGAYESDWIEFPGGGGAFYGPGGGIRDEVIIESFATGSQTINLTPALPLPLPGTGDRLNLPGIVFDGSATLPGTIGWDLRGVSGNVLDGGVTFRNFPDDGIIIGNGAVSNRLLNPRVEDCGGDGISLGGAATENYLYIPQVTGADGAGIRLSGAGVTRNYFASDTSVPLNGAPGIISIKDSGSHGVVLEGGAHGNIVDAWEVRGSGGDGVRLTGAGTVSNQIGGAQLPGFRDVAGNTGHGVSLLEGASDNYILNVSAAGNGGDGFRLEGPVTMRNHLRSIATGFDFAAKLTPAFIARNAGHSVRILDSPWNLIGSQARGPFLNSPFSALGGSSGGATVLITGAGAHHNIVDSADFGFLDPINAPNNTAPDLLLVPAATHAIHITGGAHDNVIGHDHRDAAVSILATPNGSGVRIEGAGTDNNHVYGVTFGLLRTDITLTGQQVRTGVHVLNGARSNRIGEPGNQRVTFNEEGSSQPYNAFGAIVEAGVRLENVQSGVDADGGPVGANVVLNSRMGFVSTGGPNLIPEVGIHLKGSVTGQWIGGTTRAEGNQMSRYGFAGLWIEGGVIPDYPRRNRITGTWTNAGVGTSGTAITDPFAGPLAAQGLLITGGSGQVVGEEWPLYNQFNGSRLAGYVDGGTGHWIRAAQFDSGLRGGLFIRSGTGHRVGGTEEADKVHSTRGGTAGDADTAGIVIAGGSGNRIEGCLIGDRGTVDTIWGSRGHGVLIHESSGNYIGGSARTAGNVIVGSGVDGIAVRGAAANGNQIGHNSIGTGSRTNRPNAGAGIRFSAGAHDNLVGGLQIPAGAPLASSPLPAPNRIQNNTGDGVHVTGAATTGNRILSNSIAFNTGDGIRLASGGNHLHPAPAVVRREGTILTGEVGSLAVTPAGSRIEAFNNDPGLVPEGERYIGYGEVEADGSFTIVTWAPPDPNLTVTATHAVTGDTSEFGVLVAPPEEKFGFSLAVPPGESLLTKPWPAGTPFTAVVLTAAAEGARVELQTLKVKASGTGAFAAALAGVSIFEDVDENGVWSAPDRELAPLTAFTAGETELHLEDAFVEEHEDRRWALRLHPAGAPPAGTVRLEIADANAVGEFYWQPLGATGVRALFPLQSALFQPGAADPRAVWRSSYGLPADGSGNGADNADPDNDDFVNLLEYALGSSPVDGKDAARPAAARASTPDRITFTFQKLRADVLYTVEAATTLTGPWSSAGVDQGGAGPSVIASVPVNGGRKFLRLRVQ